MTARVINLEERLDLRAATPLAEALSAARGEALMLDAAAVDQIGALAVQVIRSAAQSWSLDGHPLSLVNAATDLVDQLQLFGFDQDGLTKWDVRP